MQFAIKTMAPWLVIATLFGIKYGVAIGLLTYFVGGIGWACGIMAGAMILENAKKGEEK